jgi:hypothetical protein
MSTTDVKDKSGTDVAEPATTELKLEVVNPRVPGPDPHGRSYFTWASFSDPDGNGWLLQQITMRLPGRADYIVRERTGQDLPV